MYRLCIAYDWPRNRQIPRSRLHRFGPRFRRQATRRKCVSQFRPISQLSIQFFGEASTCRPSRVTGIPDFSQR